MYKKSLSNNDQYSLTDEIFQEKYVHETFDSFQDLRHHYHEEFIVEKPYEAQPSIEENIQNHTPDEVLKDNVKLGVHESGI